MRSSVPCFLVVTRARQGGYAIYQPETKGLDLTAERARVKLLALPSQPTPVVLTTRDRREIEEAARTIVYEALQALSGDGAGATGVNPDPDTARGAADSPGTLTRPK